MRRRNRPGRVDGAPTLKGAPVWVGSRVWWQDARARAQASIARSPSAVVRHARRWSPGIVPPLLGSLLLLATLALGTHSAPHQQPIVAPQTLLKLFVAYLLAGTLYGLVLYFAASDLVWISLLAIGLPIYLVLTLGILWGPGAAGFAGFVCMLPVVWYARRFMYAVPDGRLVVTEIGGAYARTLWRGRTLLAPGERVAAVLDAGERRFSSPMRRADIPNELGEIYQARASATVSYRLIPAEAHNAALASDDWERDLREQIGESLSQALGEWGAHLLMGDGTPPEQLLAKTLLRDLREQVRPLGIHVGWVSVRDIWLASEGELLPTDDAPERPASNVVSFPTVSRPEPQGTPSQHGDKPAEWAQSPDESEAAPVSVLSPEVLSDAYEAVREGRIKDPETIRQIANAFMKVAGDEELSERFPYDALAAAYILLDRAEAMERAR